MRRGICARQRAWTIRPTAQRDERARSKDEPRHHVARAASPPPERTASTARPPRRGDRRRWQSARKEATGRSMAAADTYSSSILAHELSERCSRGTNKRLETLRPRRSKPTGRRATLRLETCAGLRTARRWVDLANGTRPLARCRVSSSSRALRADKIMLTDRPAQGRPPRAVKRGLRTSRGSRSGRTVFSVVRHDGDVGAPVVTGRHRGSYQRAKPRRGYASFSNFAMLS